MKKIANKKSGKFYLFRRTRRNGTRKFYVQFKNPETGIPGNAVSVSRLFHVMGGSPVDDVTSRDEAYRVAQQALDSGYVFNKKKDACVVDYISAFWDFDHSDYIARRNQEKPNSIGREYANNCRKSFLKHVPKVLPKSLKLSQLRVSHVDAVKFSMAKAGLSNSTINRVLQAFRSPVEEAYRVGLISTNIADRIRNSTPNPMEKNILTPGEMARLLASLNANTKPGSLDRVYFMAIALAVTTGMRQGEIRGLHAEDLTVVSDSTTLIHVCHSFSAVDKGIKSTKGKRARMVFTSTSLAKAILARGAENPFGNGYLFWNPSSARYPVGSSALTEFFRTSLARIGIPLEEQKKRGLDFHSLRHYYASVMSNAVGSDETRRLLGHQSIEMTDHYTHEMESHLVELDKKRREVIPFEYPQESSDGAPALSEKGKGNMANDDEEEYEQTRVS